MMELHIFSIGTVVALTVWVMLAWDSRHILIAQRPVGVAHLIARTGYWLDILGIALVSFDIAIAIAATTKWYPHGAAILFSFSPYALALYGVMKLAFRRMVFAALPDETVPNGAVPTGGDG